MPGAGPGKGSGAGLNSCDPNQPISGAANRRGSVSVTGGATGTFSFAAIPFSFRAVSRTPSKRASPWREGSSQRATETDSAWRMMTASI